ncbi:YybH family protein [Haliea sp.]
MKTAKSLILSWLLACPGLMAGDATQLAHFKAAIETKYSLKEAAFAAADATPIIENFYTDDVIATDNEGKTLFGRAAIRPLYEGLVQDFNVSVESVHTYVNGDAGWDWANFHVVPKDPQAQGFSFKILFLWERIDGEWWCKGDMYVLGAFDVAGTPQRQTLNP